MNKQSEIAALKSFVSNWKGDYYLASLFTPDLLVWVENKITDDIAPNIMAALAFEHAEVLRLMGEVRQAERATKNAEIIRDQAVQDLVESKEMLTSTQADLDESYKTVEDYRNVLAEIEELAKEAWLRGETITPDSLRYILRKAEDIG